jgi:hypothetical protein
LSPSISWLVIFPFCESLFFLILNFSSFLSMDQLLTLSQFCACAAHGHIIMEDLGQPCCGRYIDTNAMFSSSLLLFMLVDHCRLIFFLFTVHIGMHKNGETRVGSEGYCCG